MKLSCEDVRSQLTELGFMDDAPAAGVTNKESLLDAQILDSLRMMELVASLEGRFHIRVVAQDLLPRNFDSIHAIASYVSERLGDGNASSGRE